MQSWREVAIVRGRWRRGAEGIEVRREFLLVRQIWTWWIAAIKMTVVEGRSKAEREAMEEREARMREEERSREMDLQNIELIEKVQELQSGKLRADAGMVDQASALEELQVGLRVQGSGSRVWLRARLKSCRLGLGFRVLGSRMIQVLFGERA